MAAFGEDDAVTLPFGEGGEIGLELWVTLQRDVKVMTQLKGCEKHPVVLKLSGDVINRLAVDRGEQSQTHGRREEISGHQRTLGAMVWAALKDGLGAEELFHQHQAGQFMGKGHRRQAQLPVGLGLDLLG